ncbi:hypothetical protein AB0F15_35330 [Amycolatopsis sp. NPDC026612]|uniref:hypothetical protein n=1 Tax=Amycolatopsis sp. NPDC026612 TaxID=3155466 RepID=UPI00340914B5
MTHTIFFAFPDRMTEADRAEFFREGSAMALGSGLVESYVYKPAIPLPTQVAPAFVPTDMAQMKYPDLDSLRKYLSHPPVAQFVGKWQRRFPYRAVSVNTED